MDRVSPTKRPPGAPSGSQRWRDLLFLHWSLPVEALRKIVPAPLEIDAWDGRAWVGLVPFAMRDVRPSWLPRGGGLDFLETNVRTYVHHGQVPGVFFFSLEASSWLAVKAARVGWGLPYFHADMAMEAKAAQGTKAFSYRSTRRSAPDASLRLAWEVGPSLGPSAPETFEHFLLERYVLFSFAREGALRRGHVHHPAYPAQRATVTDLDQGLLRAAGLDLPRDRPPEAVHYASGVDVEVFGPWRV